MNIVIDAFGGDNAPLEVIKGSVRAKGEFDIDITLVGDEEKIKKCAEDNKLDISGLLIRHADSVIEVCENPMSIRREKKDCSMAVGLRMLADGEGDAFLSAGSTGALVYGGNWYVKCIKGVKRPTLAPVLPTSTTPFMLLDAGANIVCRPEFLQQWAIMGSAYMNKIMGVTKPAVYLANIGAEESKGRELEKDAYALLKKSSINFCGNIEARDLPTGVADVVVADGYVGNMLLKLYEGMGKFMSRELKGILLDGFSSKLAALLILKKVKAFRKRMDYSEYGGSPLLGTAKPVIKAHGSSDQNAFYNAIRQAVKFTSSGAIAEMEKAIAELGSEQ